jgi:hypothetical protein
MRSPSLRSGAAFWRRLPEKRRRPSASNAGASPEDGAAADMSDMALTEGSVGYMLLIEALEVGETVLEECVAPGECCELYDRTLDAGVKAGVSLAVDPWAVAWDDCEWLLERPGGEWLER